VSRDPAAARGARLFRPGFCLGVVCRSTVIPEVNGVTVRQLPGLLVERIAGPVSSGAEVSWMVMRTGQAG
jgi:hypothetical protein